jgi:hypothetical protein
MHIVRVLYNEYQYNAHYEQVTLGHLAFHSKSDADRAFTLYRKRSDWNVHNFGELVARFTEAGIWCEPIKIHEVIV